MFEYNFMKNSWELILSEDGSQPVPRAGHTMVAFDNFLGIFGGSDEDNNKLNDLWIFDTKIRKWNEVKGAKGPTPQARCGHSASMNGSMMVIFGGLFEVTHETNDVVGFDFKGREWIEIKKENL